MSRFEWNFLRSAVAAAFCLSLCTWGNGQAQVLVSSDEEMVQVIAMDGSTPVIEVNGGRVPVTEGSIRVVPADRYTDGAIEVESCNALMGQDYGSPLGGFFFRFEALVKAERDFEDCFVLFVISPETGEDTYVIRQIRDINTKGTERIVVTIPVNPGFGGGTFGYKLFSRGEEILRHESSEPITVREIGRGPPAQSSGRASSDRTTSSGVGEPARALKARLLEFPESLVGLSSGGYATAVYSIDEQGRAFELLGIEADHAAFIPEVLKTIVETRYEPGTYNGKPLITAVRQSFFFNEFAPFAEEMIVIPYPTIKDRNAVAVFKPTPTDKVSASTKVVVELLVGTLGRVKQSEVLEGADTQAGEAAQAALEEWIFLPAIVEGFPSEQRVRVPVNFGFSE